MTIALGAPGGGGGEEGRGAEPTLTEFEPHPLQHAIMATQANTGSSQHAVLCLFSTQHSYHAVVL